MAVKCFFSFAKPKIWFPDGIGENQSPDARHARAEETRSSACACSSLAGRSAVCLSRSKASCDACRMSASGFDSKGAVMLVGGAQICGRFGGLAKFRGVCRYFQVYFWRPLT